MKSTILHMFTVSSHQSESWSTVKEHALRVAEYEESLKTSLSEWKKGWVLVCVDHIKDDYYFEVHGYYKYPTSDEFVL